jgi:vancomycin permeability regulator SanA
MSKVDALIVAANHAEHASTALITAQRHHQNRNTWLAREDVVKAAKRLQSALRLLQRAWPQETTS